MNEIKSNEYFEKCADPLWCEDCLYFYNADMGGEGECDIDNHDTWYGCPINECSHKFVNKDDVVEVVRCKHCNQWKRNSGFVDSPNGHCFYHSIDTNGYDFCSYGERKDGAE